MFVSVFKWRHATQIFLRIDFIWIGVYLCLIFMIRQTLCDETRHAENKEESA